MSGPKTRRAVFAILVVVAVLIPVWATLAAGGGAGGAGASASASGAACDHWCGNGSATVTVGGTTTTVSGGGCFDEGAAGMDARFGDWMEGQSDYVALTYFRPGGATPTPPGAVATDDMAPHPNGNVAGIPFALGRDTVIQVGADGTGTFAGTDVNDGRPIAGTFSCG